MIHCRLWVKFEFVSTGSENFHIIVCINPQISFESLGLGYNGGTVMHWNDVTVPPFRDEFHFWLERNGTSSIAKIVERNGNVTRNFSAISVPFWNEIVPYFYSLTMGHI